MLRYLMIMIFMVISLSIPVFSAQALPRNFRNVDTFLVGGMPTEEDILEFRDLGIKTIISLHKLPTEVKREAEKYGIKLYSFPWRTQLLHIEEIMTIIKESPERTVYVHCLHGADRTGAVTAYWLTQERSVDPFSALVAVLSPSEFHVRGLKQLAGEYGLSLNVPEDKVGIYSGAKNGGLEGLKICGNAWYTKLARNFLLITMGPPYNEKNERFWNKYNKNEKDVKDR